MHTQKSNKTFGGNPSANPLYSHRALPPLASDSLPRHTESESDCAHTFNLDLFDGLVLTTISMLPRGGGGGGRALHSVLLHTINTHPGAILLTVNAQDNLLHINIVVPQGHQQQQHYYYHQQNCLARSRSLHEEGDN